jgi:hypothetical protein
LKKKGNFSFVKSFKGARVKGNYLVVQLMHIFKEWENIYINTQTK